MAVTDSLRSSTTLIKSNMVKISTTSRMVRHSTMKIPKLEVVIMQNRLEHINRRPHTTTIRTDTKIIQ